MVEPALVRPVMVMSAMMMWWWTLKSRFPFDQAASRSSRIAPDVIGYSGFHRRSHAKRFVNPAATQRQPNGSPISCCGSAIYLDELREIAAIL